MYRWINIKFMIWISLAFISCYLTIEATTIHTKLPSEKTDALLPRTEQYAVDMLYDLFEVLDEKLRERGVEYTLDGGSLLGAIRHGGLIPWDDDGDIVILQKDYNKVLSLKRELNRIGIEMVVSAFGMRIFFQDAESVPKNFGIGNYPYIDIFTMKRRKKRYHYATRWAYKYWPHFYIEPDEWDGITDVNFGHLILRGLSEEAGIRYMSSGYGEDWDEVAYRIRDHKTATACLIKKLKLVDRRHAMHSQKAELGLGHFAKK